MVLKHCSLKFSDSSTSSPEDGSGRLTMFAAPGTEEDVDVRSPPAFFTGLRRVVMAWTLGVVCEKSHVWRVT